MHKAILFIAFMLPVFAASATSSGSNSLKLHSKSGHDVVVLFCERPRVTFVGNDIVVNTNMGIVSYSADDIVRFTYESVAPSAINNVQTYGMTISFSDDAVRIANLSPCERVSLYAIDGKLLRSTTADSQGRVSLQLRGNTNIVYLLKTSSTTLKIRRP